LTIAEKFQISLAGPFEYRMRVYSKSNVAAILVVCAPLWHTSPKTPYST
jgi:hypothetical protein